MKSKFLQDEIIRLHKEGNSISEISEQLPFSGGEVYDLLKSKNLIKPVKKRKISEEEILKLLKSGKSAGEIASDSGIRIQLVQSVMGKYKLLRKYEYREKIIYLHGELRKAQKETAKQVVKLYEKGHTKEELMKKLGISRKTVSAIIRHYITHPYQTFQSEKNK